MTTKLSPEEKKNRKLLFGELRDGFRPIYTYRWQLDECTKGPIEIPVTTMPLFKIPFHVSYVLYLSRFSPVLARIYFQLAMKLCRLTHISPSLLLHPLDFLGCNDVKELSFFPAMDITSEKKIKLVSEVLRAYSENFTVVPLWQHARAFSHEKDLLNVEPKFRSMGNVPVTKNLF